MARACLAWGLQPSEYKALTRTEREAFRTQANRLADQMRRK